MKRRDLVRHLQQHGCIVGGGTKHETAYNPATRQQSRIPRHREVPNHLADVICQQLRVPHCPKR